MLSLNEFDLSFIKRRMPKKLLKLLKDHPGEVFVAGGFIRACVAGEKVNDIDCFVTSKEAANILSSRLVPASGKTFRTENAVTVSGLPYPVQFIHRWTFDTPAACVESFDFTVARAAVWYDYDVHGFQKMRSICDDSFYQDLAAKRLVYRCPELIEEAGGSMLRVLKFYQRGYRIPLDSLSAVMARLAVAVDDEKLHGSMMAHDDTREQAIARIYHGLLREVDPNVDPDHDAH